MKNMKNTKNMINLKKIMALLLFISLTGTLTACVNKSVKSYNFSPVSGDKITLEFDTSNGYTLKTDSKNRNNIFYLTNAGKDVSTCSFVSQKTIEKYQSDARTGKVKRLIENKTVDDKDYVLYETDEDSQSGYQYAIYIKGTKTGVIIKNIQSLNVAKELIEAMTFKLK